MLEDLHDRVGKGSLAYNFSLPEKDGTIVKLSDFKGKIVFLDFWLSGCSGCVYYYKEVLSKVGEEYADEENLVFITISIDRKRERWLRSLTTGNFTSPEFINLYAGGTDNSAIRNYNVSSVPKQILIDQEGRIITSSKLILGDGERLRLSIEKALE